MSDASMKHAAEVADKFWESVKPLKLLPSMTLYEAARLTYRNGLEVRAFLKDGKFFAESVAGDDIPPLLRPQAT